MESPAIGIDLGTTFSCVSVWQDGKVKIIPNDQGNLTTPSYVAFTETERLIGDLAKMEAVMSPKNTVYDIKRIIGRKFDDPTVQADMKHWPFTVIGDDEKLKVRVEYKEELKELLPEEISAMILMKLKETAETYLDCSVTNTVITVPAYFNDSQRQATKDAGTIAGLNVLRILNEPTAAALAYGLDQNLKGKRNVLTFDLGGGTFDVSILTIDEGSLYEVKSTAGNTHLGGEDFDNRLVNYLAGEFKEKHKKDLLVNPRAVCKLRTAAERAKRNLSSCRRTNIVIDGLHDGIDFCTRITRPQFEDICSDLFRATLTTVQDALTDAKLDKDAIDDIVLVGGSTRIPKVQSMLQDFFRGKSLKHSINPDEAVAYGAAIHAAVLSGNKSSQIKDILLLDVTPLSLGIEDVHGQFCVVINRNTRIPCKKTSELVTSEDNQKLVAFTVFEGERALCKDNNLLGEFLLTGFPLAPEGEVIFDVTFDIDANGILSVTAEERSTKKSNGIVIKNEKGRLSTEEINRIIKEAEQFKEEDDKHRARLNAKVKLQDYAYEVKQVAAESGSKLTEKEKDAVLEQVDNTLSWLKKNHSAGLGEFKHKFQELQNVCKPKMNKILGIDELLD